MAFGFKSRNEPQAPATNAASDIGDIYVSPSLKESGVWKAYIPKYLYAPPFGYPRADNVPLQRRLSQNPYIFSIIKTVADEVATADYEIVFKEDSERKDDPKLEEMRKQIDKFFHNPNQNKESWTDLRKMFCHDLLETDAGVFVKIFNRMQQFSQLVCRDGGSFLKNPDIYGYMGNREEFIDPVNYMTIVNNYQATRETAVKQYALGYAEKAAYFQYGTAVTASIPVPFGRREIIYAMQNPRADSLYGRSPIAILADVITTLVYGSNYNLDFYMNNNMPEGIIQILGAEKDEITAFRSRMEKQYRVTDEMTGFPRKVAFKIPITGSEAKFVPFQLDPKTMQVLEQQQWFYKIALACFGVPADAMGFTENSNLATGQNQYKLYMRKSAKPILSMLKYKVDNEIISEWGQEAYDNLEYKWCDYDLDEQIKKFSLYDTQIRIGVKTPKMVAEEEGIDYSEVEEYKQEQMQQAQAQMRESQENNPNSSLEPNAEEDSNPVNNFMQKYGLKAISEEGELDDTEMTELEKEINTHFKQKSSKIIKALEELDDGSPN